MRATLFILLMLTIVGGTAAARAEDRAGHDDGDRRAPARSGNWVRDSGTAHLRSWLNERSLGRGDMAVENWWTDTIGMGHLKAHQQYRGVRVFGGELIVHMRPGGALASITDNHVPGVQVDTRANLGWKQALEIALREHDCNRCFTRKPKVDEWVMRQGEKDRLVYRIQLFREDGSAETGMPVIFVDAHDGSIVMAYDNLQTAGAIGAGPSLYSGTVNLNTFLSGSTFYMEDVSRKLGTFTSSNGTSSVFRLADANNVWDSAVQRAAVDAHYGAAKTYDYFLSVHGRNGIDGAGGPAYYTAVDGVTGLVSARVHYSVNYNNAFWNGQYMTYGDGDGITFGALVALDIAGHEMIHGITERTAGLVYSGESGALNESMSDVFGNMVERYARGESANTWRIGEDAYTPGTAGDALRFMDNPHAASNSGFTADDDPDHYSERYTGASDNGGVHVNSGIPNKAFYLLAQGGSHHLGGSLTGIGADAAARIWYSALTNYLTTSTNFAGARTGTLNAATALYGAASVQHAAVAQAWCLVGVGACARTGNLLVNGGFEGSVAPWVPTGQGALYIANGTYPRGGTGYVYLGSVNSVTGQSYQQFAIPPTATTATLSFWLNVTSAEITATTRYDTLNVEVRDAAGTLLGTVATYSNLDKGTAGVYTQRGGFSLLAYRGQTIRLQFRVSTDSSAITTFRVDDVAVN